MIHHWRSYFGERTLLEHARRHPSSMRDSTPPAPGVALGVETHARVSGSVWIADCPVPGCAGAELVNFDDPFFFCCECRNAHVGHQLIKVTVPDAKLRAAVEHHLLARPALGARHWLPGETPGDLRRQNLEHGVRS